MKIGLEYEGVIIDNYGQVVRWSSLPYDQQDKITRLCGDPAPHDGYDCLAEARIAPIVDPTPEKLVAALLGQASSAMIPVVDRAEEYMVIVMPRDSYDRRAWPIQIQDTQV